MRPASASFDSSRSPAARMCRLRRASLWFWSRMIASLLSSLKGKRCPWSSGEVLPFVLLLLQLRDIHLQDSRGRSRLFPAFAEDTSCTSAHALWRLLESSARSAFYSVLRPYEKTTNIHSVVIDSSSAGVIYGVQIGWAGLRYQLLLSCGCSWVMV